MEILHRSQFLVCLIFAVSTYSQNTGIGTTTPLMKMHVSSTDTGALLLENINSLSFNSNTGMYFLNGSYYTGAVKTIGTGSVYARLGFFTYAAVNPNTLLERLSVTDEGNVGIGTISPTAKLEVNGNIRITGGSPSAGKVLMSSDASGTASWQLPPTDNSGFKAYVDGGGTYNIPAGSNYTLNYASEEYDDANAFSLTSFVAPSAGLYHFDAAITWNLSNVPTNAEYIVAFQINGSSQHPVYMVIPANSGSGLRTQSISADFKLLAGNTVTVSVAQFSGIIQQIAVNFLGLRYTWFSGRRIY